MMLVAVSEPELTVTDAPAVLNSATLAVPADDWVHVTPAGVQSADVSHEPLAPPFQV